MPENYISAGPTDPYANWDTQGYTYEDILSAMYGIDPNTLYNLPSGNDFSPYDPSYSSLGGGPVDYSGGSSASYGFDPYDPMWSSLGGLQPTDPSNIFSTTGYGMYPTDIPSDIQGGGGYDPSSVYVPPPPPMPPPQPDYGGGGIGGDTPWWDVTGYGSGTAEATPSPSSDQLNPLEVPDSGNPTFYGGVFQPTVEPIPSPQSTQLNQPNIDPYSLYGTLPNFSTTVYQPTVEPIPMPQSTQLNQPYEPPNFSTTVYQGTPQATPMPQSTQLNLPPIPPVQVPSPVNPPNYVTSFPTQPPSPSPAPSQSPAPSHTTISPSYTTNNVSQTGGSFGLQASPINTTPIGQSTPSPSIAIQTSKSGEVAPLPPSAGPKDLTIHSQESPLSAFPSQKSPMDDSRQSPSSSSQGGQPPSLLKGVLSRMGILGPNGELLPNYRIGI